MPVFLNQDHRGLAGDQQPQGDGEGLTFPGGRDYVQPGLLLHQLVQVIGLAVRNGHHVGDIVLLELLNQSFRAQHRCLLFNHESPPNVCSEPSSRGFRCLGKDPLLLWAPPIIVTHTDRVNFGMPGETMQCPVVTDVMSR